MDDRLGPDEWLSRLRNALATAGVNEGELYVHRRRRGFARYALNTLGQHGDLFEEHATARVGIPVEGGYRLASVGTTDLSHEGLVRALRRAADIARHAEPVPGWPGFARPEGSLPVLPRFCAATAQCTAQDRAVLLAPAIDRARALGLTAAGVLNTTVYEIAVANTAGVARYADGTIASFKIFALDPDGISGFAQQTDRDVTRLAIPSLAEQACQKSLAGKNPVSLPPGEYDVILEPPAVTELLEWLSFIAFGAREVLDGTSPLAGRTGEAITGSQVTIVDDACDPDGFGVPFDREGVVRQRVVLIDHGRAGEPVYDLLYAARAGRRSTGHAAPPGGFDDGPVPQAIQMEGGTDTLETLTRRVQRGLHVSRLHYVNGFLDPRRAVMTGLTRDGTFLIENGQRTRGVRNMRFTDSVLEAFRRIDGLSAWRAAVPTWWSEAGAFVAPAVLIRGLRFTAGGER